MLKSAYIHIPFCKSKCKYCSFVSFNKLELMTGYVYSLLKEIDVNYKGEELNTLYFGGGTPSLLPPELIAKIIKKFNLAKDAEVTFELNPDDADIIPYLTQLGINRLSIGSQTFNNEVLNLIGRRHKSEDIINTVNLAKEAGFKNISLDLIYGLPVTGVNKEVNKEVRKGVTSKINIKRDLEKFLELDIQHISTYGLKIEENSFWGKNGVNVPLPEDDEQADMYEVINETLEKAGFRRYEVSNFAKKGFESKHNLNYWNNNEYYGFGVAAHGYVDGIRYSNFSTLEKYIENPCVHECGHFVSKEEKLEEEIFLGFRKTSGVHVQQIKEKFGIDFENKYKSVLMKYSGYFIKTDIGYALNLKGTLLSNVILAEFLAD